jgi:hypothetical protein
MRATLIRRFVVLGLTLAAAAGCSSTVREGRSPVYLVVLNLEAASGAEPDEMTNTLQSDVLTCGGVFEDPGLVTMRVQYKDPTAGTIDPVNFVTLNRYRIDFRRADGRNVPGVDVPYGFDGAATTTIAGNATQMTLVAVRAQAKLEPPLRNLRDGGGAGLISTLADVTFYGKDQTGTDVTVMGTISVNFADWADPDCGGSDEEEQ